MPEERIGRSFRQTVMIDAERSIMKTVRAQQHTGTRTSTWFMEPRGDTLKLTGRCPEGLGSESVRYGATATELVTSFEQAGVPVVVTYRRRSG